MRTAITVSVQSKLLHELSGRSTTEIQSIRPVNGRQPFRCQGGSFICERYELRITLRCLVSDLGFESSTRFAEARAHPIVHAFETQRATEPIGTRTVGPAAGDLTVHRLGHGHDHRGATWYDQAERVVWLCAYRLHRSGEDDDAFPYFHDLIGAGALMPTEDDYAALFEDRGRRFVETLYEDAQQLLDRARSNVGVEQVGILGGEETAAVLVEVVDTLHDTYVAFSVAGMDTSRLLMILGAFDTEAAFSDWELVEKLPTRTLRAHDGEICYRILRS